VCSSKALRFMNLDADSGRSLLRMKNQSLDISGVREVWLKQVMMRTRLFSIEMASTGQASAQIRQSGGQPGSSISGYVPGGPQ